MSFWTDGKSLAHWDSNRHVGPSCVFILYSGDNIKRTFWNLLSEQNVKMLKNKTTYTTIQMSGVSTIFYVTFLKCQKATYNCQTMIELFFLTQQITRIIFR